MGDTLLQRLNFFLIGTAFLITGLAALVVSGRSGGLNGDQLTLAYIINSLGLYLALLFTVIDALNMAVLADFGKR